MYYTLNLGFDLSNAAQVQNGQFVDNASGQPPLLTSKAWLQSTTPPLSPNTTYTVLPDNTVTVGTGDIISVRMYPATAVVSPTVRLTVVFGRPHGAPQGQALRAPFTLRANVCCAVFDYSNTGPNQNDGSWMYQLATVTDAPIANQIHKYGFIVGATVWTAGVAFTFGHDPDMDVTSSSKVQTTYGS
jgi:hypothetical protein